MFTYMIYILETAEMVFLICTGVDENVVDNNDSSNCKDMNNSFEDKYNEDSDGFNDGDSFNEDKYNGSFDDYYGVDENKEDTDDNDEDIDDIVDEISLEEVNKPSYYPFKSKEELDVHRTHTPRCEVKKIIALWRMHAVMQGWKEVGCED